MFSFFFLLVSGLFLCEALAPPYVISVHLMFSFFVLLVFWLVIVICGELTFALKFMSAHVFG